MLPCREQAFVPDRTSQAPVAKCSLHQRPALFSLSPLFPAPPHGGARASCTTGGPAGAGTGLPSRPCLRNPEPAPSRILEPLCAQTRPGQWRGKQQSEKSVVCDLRAEWFTENIAQFSEQSRQLFSPFLQDSLLVPSVCLNVVKCNIEYGAF